MLMGWSGHVDCVPGAADFRLLSRRTVVALQQMREVHRYLRGMVPWLGFTSAVVHYAQAPRHAGTPAYTWQRSLRLAHHGLFSFTTLPLNLITLARVLLRRGSRRLSGVCRVRRVLRPYRPGLVVGHRRDARRQRLSVHGHEHPRPVPRNGVRRIQASSLGTS